jgi:hypothetical protein
MTMTVEKWQEAEKIARGTGKMANTLAKALAKRFSKRWQFVDFLGPHGRESAGIVDIVAIRKSGEKPKAPGLKRLDLFDILLIQVKGGSAAKPNDKDIARLRGVSKYYHAKGVVLFQWKKKKQTGFSVLNSRNEWEDKAAADLFG